MAVGFDLVQPRELRANYTQFVLGDCQCVDKYFPTATFDTIIAGELIEHLENPASFLKSCRKIVTNEGRLLLTTPNPYHWSTVIGNLFFVRSGVPREHINLFPFRAMLALLQHCGWDLLEVKSASGGMRLWHTTRTYFLPCPKAIAWQLLYICKKDLKK